MATIDQVARAFIAGKSAKCHNAHTDGITYTLHSTVICRKPVDGGNAYDFRWGGYYTPTTASHMNAIIEAGELGERVSYAKARDERHHGFHRPFTPPGAYPQSERLQDLLDARSATFALVHKVRSMRGAPDPGPVIDSELSVGYKCGPICPHYTAEDLAKYERELADLDHKIAATRECLAISSGIIRDRDAHWALLERRATARGAA